MKKTIVISLALLLGVTLGRTQTVVTEKTVVTDKPVVVEDKPVVVEHHEVDESNLLFRANELSLDLFGTVAVGEHTLKHLSANRVREDGELGLGVGLNFFFLRFLGIGAEAYSTDVNHIFVENASANLIVRFPIEPAHLAPYIYGGGGYQWEPGEEWFVQFGGGLDVRITRNWGLFADARYVIPEHGGNNFGIFRGGLRFVF